MSCKRTSMLNPTVTKFELSYVGDSETNLSFIQKHGELVQQLNEQFLKEQFNHLTGNTGLKVKRPIDLAATLEIMRTIDQDIVAYSKNLFNKENNTTGTGLDYFITAPKPMAVTIPTRSDLVMWDKLMHSNSFIVRLDPNNFKDVIP